MTYDRIGWETAIRISTTMVTHGCNRCLIFVNTSFLSYDALHTVNIKSRLKNTDQFDFRKSVTILVCVMKNVAETTNDNNKIRAILTKIASTLECSVEELCDKSLNDPDQTIELLQLWSSIISAEDRKKVLAYMLTIASQAPPTIVA